MWKFLCKMIALCALYAHSAHANDVKSLIIELSDSNHLILSLTETPQTTNCGKNLFISSKEFSGEMEFVNVKKFYYSTIEASSTVSELPEQIDVTVFPNPCSDYIFISTKNENIEIKCYDATGKCVPLSPSFDGQKHQLDLFSIPKGTYLLHIDKQSFKFIKH